MITEFGNLSDSEVELMFKTPLLVCVLLAGADNNIDQSEIQEAIDLAKKKSRKSRALLIEFYSIVAQDFEDKLKIVIQTFPSEATQRNPLITLELAQLNSILAKIDKSFAIHFYESIKEIAQKIAESSGGMLWIKNSIGSEEAKFVGLPMIKNPATY